MLVSCPSCGGEVEFKSRFSIFQVCTYCTSMIVRIDKNVELIGKMADLPSDMSPFQIGTTGFYEERKFEIIGKQRLVYESGNWNEWYVIFDNGQVGWLGEAQGFLSMSFQVFDENIPDIQGKTSGQIVTLMNESFEIEDIKNVVCEGGIGELPVRSEKGRKFLSIDLACASSVFANITIDGQKTSLFIGSYLDFDDFRFGHLREIDGW